MESNGQPQIKPRIFSARDEGVQGQIVNRTLGQGMLVGMLAMTYPQDIVVQGRSN